MFREGNQNPYGTAKSLVFVEYCSKSGIVYEHYRYTKQNLFVFHPAQQLLIEI